MLHIGQWKHRVYTSTCSCKYIGDGGENDGEAIGDALLVARNAVTATVHGHTALCMRGAPLGSVVSYMYRRVCLARCSGHSYPNC